MSILIEKVRTSSKPRGRYRDKRGNPRNDPRPRWNVYWRCVRDGRIVNTFLTKKAAAKWVKEQRA